MPTLKVLKATGVYTILGFIPLVSSFVLLPIYTQYLHASDYGIVALGGLTENYLMVFLTFGLSVAFSVFFFDHEKTPEGVDGLLSNTLSAVIGNAGIIAALLAFFGNWFFLILWDGNLPFERFGWFIFSNAVFLALNQILFQYYRIKENLKAVIIVTLVPFIFSTAGGIIGVIVLEQGAFGSIAWKAAGTIMGSLPFYIFIFSRIGFKIKKAVLQELYIYAYPFVIIFFLTAISETVDKFLLNKYFDLKTLGLYNFASVVVTPVAILIQSYWNSVTPAMYRIVSEDNAEKDNKLSVYFKGTLFITLIAIWGVIMVVDPVIRIVASKGYYAATYFVPILGIAVLGKAYFNIYTFKASFYKKTKFLPIINIASFVVGLIIALTLLEFLGIWAILISVLISRLVQGLAAYFIEKKLGLHFYSVLNQGGLVIFSFIVIAINYLYLYKQKFLEFWLINLMEGILFFIIIAIMNRSNLLKGLKHFSIR